jgi:hypothetical protein
MRAIFQRNDTHVHISCTSKLILHSHTGYQYNETNVMHFLFNLLRLNGLYMFRALLAHPHESLHKRHLVYCVRVLSVGCYQDWSGTGVWRHQFHSNPANIAANIVDKSVQ